MHPAVEAALKIARGEVGVRESPSNWGPKVELYLASVGLHDPGRPV